MIRKIKKKVRQFEQNSAGMQRLEEDQMALTQLLKMFDNGVFLPLTGWSVSPREVLHACNEIVIQDRKCVVEFGAGFSTICIARLLQITGKKARFFSIEGDAQWASELSRILDGLNLSDFVKIIVAPITPLPAQFAFKGEHQWYDVNVINTGLGEDVSPDLVIVDGPQGATCDYARYPAVPFLLDRLAGDFAIFLDDSSRPEEMAIAEQWGKLLGTGHRNYNRYILFKQGESVYDTAPFGFTRL